MKGVEVEVEVVGEVVGEAEVEAVAPVRYLESIYPVSALRRCDGCMREVLTYTMVTVDGPRRFYIAHLPEDLSSTPAIVSVVCTARQREAPP